MELLLLVSLRLKMKDRTVLGVLFFDGREEFNPRPTKDGCRMSQENILNWNSQQSLRNYYYLNLFQIIFTKSETITFWKHFDLIPVCNKSGSAAQLKKRSVRPEDTLCIFQIFSYKLLTWCFGSLFGIWHVSRLLDAMENFSTCFILLWWQERRLPFLFQFIGDKSPLAFAHDKQDEGLIYLLKG